MPRRTSYSTSRCDHCTGGNTGKRRSGQPREREPKRRPQQRVTDAVRDEVQARRRQAASSRGVFAFVRAEQIALSLGLRKSQVRVALGVLNREGLVDQPTHRAPHDSRRATGMDYGPDNAWSASIYALRMDTAVPQ